MILIQLLINSIINEFSHQRNILEVFEICQILEYMYSTSEDSIFNCSKGKKLKQNESL
jgi:hypothetical protein